MTKQMEELRHLNHTRVSFDGDCDNNTGDMEDVHDDMNEEHIISEVNAGKVPLRVLSQKVPLKVLSQKVPLKVLSGKVPLEDNFQKVLSDKVQQSIADSSSDDHEDNSGSSDESEDSTEDADALSLPASQGMDNIFKTDTVNIHPVHRTHLSQLSLDNADAFPASNPIDQIDKHTKLRTKHINLPDHITKVDTDADIHDVVDPKGCNVVSDGEIHSTPLIKLPTRSTIPRRIWKHKLDKNRMSDQRNLQVCEAYTLSHQTQKRLVKTSKVAGHLPKIPAGWHQLNTDPAITDEHRQGFFQAMADELNSHIKGKPPTFIAVDKMDIDPSDKLWNSLWQYDIKIDADGKFLKYKARLCFQGSKRKLGVDHSLAEIFTHVLRLQTLRIVQSYFIQKIPTPGMDLFCELWDVKTAFVQALLHKKIFMRVPRGVAGWEGKILRLLKALYGLAEAHKYFDEFFAKILLDIGFHRSEGDSSLYRITEGEEEIVLPLYVDDMTAHCHVRKMKGNLRDRILDKLANVGLIITVSVRDRFKSLGMLMEYDWVKGTVSLSQKHAKLRLIEMAQFQNRKPKSTPLPKGTICERPKKADLPVMTPEEKKEMDKYPYRTFLGKIGDMVQRTCPHLVYAFSQLSRWADNPQIIHKELMDHLIQFLIGDLDQKLVFHRRNLLELACKIVHFCDSGFAQDSIDRRSQGCCLGFVYGNLIWWLSRRMPFICCSSMWAEVANTYETSIELMWERNILEFLGDKEHGPSIMWGDNYPHILGCYNKNMNHSATKSIETKHKWAWEKIHSGDLIAAHITRTRMIADAGTKQEGRSIWRPMVDIWMGKTFIPELLGVKNGQIPQQVKRYMINTNDPDDDPTLKYLLACDRHTVDDRLPDAITNMLMMPEDVFVGMLLEESESYKRINGRVIDNDIDAEVFALSSEVYSMHERMMEIQTRLRQLEIITARAQLERFDIATNIERMRIIEEDCQTRTRLITSRNRIPPPPRPEQKIEYEDSIEGDEESIYDPDELYGVNSPRFSLSDADITTGYDAELLHRLNNDDVSDSNRTQPVRWSDVDSDSVGQTREDFTLDSEVDYEPVEQKRDQNVPRLTIHDVSLDNLDGEMRVMVTKRGVIHHVECNSVRNRAYCKYMSVSETRANNRYRLPTKCCRKKFLEELIL